MRIPGPASPPLVDLAYLLFPALWIGLLTGVCFIATLAKFHAPSLSRQAALDVGRTTFAAWNHVEWGLLILALPLLLYSENRLDSVLAFGMVGAVLLTQTMVLLPVLNGRAGAIIAGAKPAPSADHAVYVAADILKTAILASIIWREWARFVSLLHP